VEEAVIRGNGKSKDDGQHKTQHSDLQIAVLLTRQKWTNFAPPFSFEREGRAFSRADSHIDFGHIPWGYRHGCNAGRIGRRDGFRVTRSISVVPEVSGLAFLTETPSLVGWPQIGRFTEGVPKMAKGMEKRRRDEKKPKKVVPKTIAAAPSLKNVVASAPTLKAKAK